jgi:arylsulfatase A-like enzyme
MTGRYQQRVGIVDVIASHLDTPGLDPSEFTISRMLKQKGYATALFGKWHLSAKPEQNPIYHGFDEFRGYLPGAMDYHSHKNTWYNGLKLEDQPGYTTHNITSNAVQFIERNRGHPFFLYVAHQAVHLPFQTPDDTPDKRQPVPADQTGSRDRIRPKYKIMLEELDKGIGQILDTLERTGLSRRTLVFFFSDNGAIGAGSNAPFRGGKFSLYEGGTREPAIAYWPGHIQPNTRTDQFAAGMDLLPTFAQIAGVKIPAGRALDGVSLRGVLLNGEKLPPRRIFFGYEPKLGTALRDDRFKAILKHSGEFELYDLSTDIGEKTNLVTQFPDRAAQMRQAIETWRDQFKASSK